jgi:hypothetical protein
MLFGASPLSRSAETNLKRYASAIKEEIEGMRQLVATYAKAIVETMVLRDPEAAKEYLRRNPQLLRLYLERSLDKLERRIEEDKARLGELARGKRHVRRRSREEYLSEEMGRLLRDNEALERFIKGIIVRD